MSVVINEVVTEVVLGPDAPVASAPAARGMSADEELVELVVRRSVERVLETLRREWDA